MMLWNFFRGSASPKFLSAKAWRKGWVGVQLWGCAGRLGAADTSTGTGTHLARAQLGVDMLLVVLPHLLLRVCGQAALNSACPAPAVCCE